MPSKTEAKPSAPERAALPGGVREAAGSERHEPLAGHFAMQRFVQATSRELQKIGRLPSTNEFSEHYALIREGGVA